MIWFYVVTFFGNLMNWAFSWLPQVTVLPLGMDTALSTATGYFRSFMAVFPPLTVVFTAFIWYLSFRIMLLTLKLLRIIR